VDDAGIATYQPPHSTTMQDDSMWRAQRVIENGHIVGASAQATLWAQAVETFLDSNRNGNEHSMDELPTVPPKLRNDGRNECWWNVVLQATLSMLHELHLRPVALENGTTSDVYRIFLFAFPELRNHTPNKDVLWAQLVEHQFVSALDQGQQSEADTFWLNLMSEGPLSHLVRTTMDEARVCCNCDAGRGDNPRIIHSGQYVNMPRRTGDEYSQRKLQNAVHEQLFQQIEPVTNYQCEEPGCAGLTNGACTRMQYQCRERPVCVVLKFDPVENKAGAQLPPTLHLKDEHLPPSFAEGDVGQYRYRLCAVVFHQGSH